MFVADAALIKVKRFFLTWFCTLTETNENTSHITGNHVFSSSLAKTCLHISFTHIFWKEYCRVRRWRLETIQESHSASVLGCKCMFSTTFPNELIALQRNNRLVWGETCRIMQDLFDNIWGNKDEIMLHNCVDVTLQACCIVLQFSYHPNWQILKDYPGRHWSRRQASLNSGSTQLYIHLIFRLGFGRRVPLIDDLTIPEGHKLTFKDALHIVSTGTPAKIIFPKWMMSVTAGLAKVQLGFDELHVRRDI